MRSREVHNPITQSRARVFELAKRNSALFSPLIDAFHPSFPAWAGDYISEPLGLNTESSTHGPSTHHHHCLDASHGPRGRFELNAHCRVKNASVNESSGAIDSAADAHCYHGQETGELLPSSSDPILKLPLEVSDLILSYLSPAALDAATHTCKEWRMMVMSNTWILSSVLAVNANTSLDGSSSDTLSHRDLLTMLDRNSDLPSTFQHPDAWRTRFRIRSIEFSIPPPSSESRATRPTLVAAVRTGTQNGFIVLQLQDSPRVTRHGMKSTLIIYRFDSADRPWYAGTIQDAEGQGALHIPVVLEIKRHAEWVLKIEIGDTAGLYSLHAREAFSNRDSRFSLKRLESLEKASGMTNANLASQRFDRPPELLPLGDQFWEVLAPFPPNPGVRASGISQIGFWRNNANKAQLRHGCPSEGVRKHAEPRFLAEQVENGNIYVIVEVAPSEEPSPYARYSQSISLSNDSEGGNHGFTGTALLSRPRLDSVYKNVAVAPSISKDGSARVAIVWQTTDLDKPISELYIYDIPETIYDEPCRSYSLKTGGDASANAESLGDRGRQRPCRLVQGKRVTWVDQHMGGIHPSSPLHRLGSPQATALGGLQFPHTTENQDARPRNVQYQKCFVWGPATYEDECKQMFFKIIDFSFADPQRLHSLMAYGVRARQRRNRDPHIIALNHVHCACALHDKGFQIILPDVTIIKASELVTIKRKIPGEAAPSSLQISALLKQNLLPNGNKWSLWPGEPASPQDCVRDVGTVLQNDPLARRAALERWRNWLMGRIVRMKRMGLSEFEIAELWNLSPWTQYGQVRKPDGWRELNTDDV